MKLIKLIVPLAVFLFGCARPDVVKKFGPEFNTERTKFGLRFVQPDAVLANEHDDKFPMWINPVRKEKGNPLVPHWVSKQLEIQNGVIKQETETYSSGHEYSVLDKGMREEQLVIRFDYQKAAAGMNPWSCKIFWGPSQGEYSLEQAESILKKWGIARR